MIQIFYLIILHTPAEAESKLKPALNYFFDPIVHLSK